MRSFIALSALAVAVSAQLRIETPAQLIECQPAKISWAGGSAPYFPAVIPGGQPSAQALKSFPQTSDTSLTWTVDIASPQRVTLRITDSTGAINYAEQVTIQSGSNKSCLSNASASNSTTGGAASSGSSAVSSASGAVSSAASSASSAASGAASGARSSVSGAASSASTTVSSASASGSRAASASSGAAYLGAQPKIVGGLLGAVASVFGAFML